MKLPIADCRLPGTRVVLCQADCEADVRLRPRSASQAISAPAVPRVSNLPCAASWDNSRSYHSSFTRLSISNRQSSIANNAFTLIEIMIVVGIIGLLAAMGMPSLSKALQKEGMRKAVSDVQDVFFSARERAIISGKKVAVVFHPRERQFGVEGTTGVGDSGTVVNAHSGKTLVATLPPGVEFAMLDIFRQDYVQSDWAKVFFNPDGTSDEAVVVLLSKGRAQKITLEYATGMPVVSAADQ